MFLSLTLNIFHNFSSVFIVDFEQVNINWMLSIIAKPSLDVYGGTCDKVFKWIKFDWKFGNQQSPVCLLTNILIQEDTITPTFAMGVTEGCLQKTRKMMRDYLIQIVSYLGKTDRGRNIPTPRVAHG